MFRVITISRQYGSGGGEIARRLCACLHWRLVDEWVVAEIAKRARVSPSVAAQLDECLDPWFHRMVKALWQGGYEGAASVAEKMPVDSDAVAALTAQVIHEAAEIGDAVIVGRGAQCILRHNPQAFRVSIYAPREMRLVALRERLPQGTAVESEMDEVDRRRAGYIRHYFDRDWTDRWLYHLSVSSAVGLDRAVESILRAAGLAPQTPL